MGAPDTELTQAEDVLEFMRALPHWIRRDVNSTGRLAVLVIRSTRDNGWPLDALVTKCTRAYGPGVINPGGLLMHRLEDAAATPYEGQSTSTVGPLCGQCQNGWIDHFTPDGLTYIGQTKCPCRTPRETNA